MLFHYSVYYFRAARRVLHHIYLALTQENLSLVFGNNKGADQTVHLGSLISAFVIRLLESILSKLATSQFSILLLVFVVEEMGLSLVLSETPKTGFVASRPILRYRLDPVTLNAIYWAKTFKLFIFFS